MTKLRKIYRHDKFSYHGERFAVEDFFPCFPEPDTNRLYVPMLVFADRMNVDKRTVKNWKEDGLLPVCIKVKRCEGRGAAESCFLVSDLRVFFAENVYFSGGDL